MAAPTTRHAACTKPRIAPFVLLSSLLFSDFSTALAVAVAMILAWAVPAGLAGGGSYRQAIFWGHTAHRMVVSVAHRAPVAPAPQSWRP